MTPVRVGAFELDLHARELRDGATRVRLQGQPFEILRVLLERPGHVVTRDELQRRLWPGGTFVDFEHSLNAAIKRLREALGGFRSLAAIHRDAAAPRLPVHRGRSVKKRPLMAHRRRSPPHLQRSPFPPCVIRAST